MDSLPVGPVTLRQSRSSTPISYSPLKFLAIKSEYSLRDVKYYTLGNLTSTEFFSCICNINSFCFKMSRINYSRVKLKEKKCPDP